MKARKVPLIIALLIVIGAGCNDHIVDPNTLQVFDLSTKVDGNGFNELSREFTKWVLGKSLNQTPLSDDENGTFHAANLQPLKNVTFLASNFGGTTTRSLTIPGSNYVFVPLISSTWSYFDNDPCSPTFQPAANQSLEDFLKANANDDVNGVTNLSAKLNGQDIVADLKPYRFSSKAFQFAINKDYTDPNCDYSGQQPTAVTDGYNLLIKLPKGKHTLSYTAAFPAYNFALDMTWNLTVE